MMCSASSGTTSHTMRSTTSADSLSSAASSGLPGSSPAASASRAAILASVRSTSSERLVGEPATIGARCIAACAALAIADAGGGGAGERIDGEVPGALPGAIGGTATTDVFVGAGGMPGAGPGAGPGPALPAGILIVGMPMIVAERGGIDADAAAAAAGATGTGLPGDVGDGAKPDAAAGGDAAAPAWPGRATPAAALLTISVTFSSMVCVSHGLGRLASAPTCTPRTVSYGAAFPIRIATGMLEVIASDLSARQRS